MKNIFLIPNTTKDTNLSVTKSVSEMLSSLGFNVYIESKYKTDLKKTASAVDSIPENTDLLIVIGGDGSVLDASVFAIERDIPILGINLGKLGYLAEVELGELELLKNLKTEAFKIEEKMLLCVSKERNNELISSTRFAVNDIILSHDTFLGISEFTLTNSYNESIKYHADGLILATPVGSTAYSLSAGGPILSHDINSITATPICPHSFFNRSIIFKDTERLCLHNTGDSELKISIDGRFFCELSPKEKCFVYSADKKLKLLTFSKHSMFSTLFGKMKRYESI